MPPQSRTLAERQAAERRRAQIAPGAAAGVTEPMIEMLVHAFYGRVREHEILGPIFNARIDDWPEHLAKLCDADLLLEETVRAGPGRPSLRYRLGPAGSRFLI